MGVCETLPLCPDVVLDAETDTALTEPVEVGPFRQGVVFVSVIDLSGSPSATARVGISPTGYEDWDHWAVLDDLSSLDAVDTYALQLSNFGNWLRLRLELDDPDPDDRIALLAWFVGDG
jgi:hypothetical protein